MATRNAAKCALLVAVALGCGGSGDPGQSEDHAAVFAGDWYGTVTYVYRHDGTIYGTNTALVQQPIMVTGKNAVLLQHFCGAADPGVGANVTSATDFSVTPHQCSVNPPTGCPFSVSVESGSGRLSGTTLALAFHGTLTQPAGSGCSARTLQFDITTSMTHDVPPGFKAEIPRDVKVEKGEGLGQYALSWTLSDSTLAVEVQTRIGGGDWNDASFLPFGDVPNLVILDLDGVPDRTPVAFRLRTQAVLGVSDWSAPASNDSGFAAPVLLDADESTGVIRLRWQPRQDVVSMVIERNDSEAAPIWNGLTVLTPPGSSYDDVRAVENNRYAYRFHWLDATTDSFRASLSPPSLPLRPPVGLTALASPGRVDLSWMNRSQLATEVVVLRANGLVDWSGYASEIAHLPASATSFSDVGLEVGMYTYSVEARLPGELTSTGPLAAVATPPPASSGTWNVSFVDLPASREAALDADGGVLTFSGSLVGSDSPAWLPYAPDGGGPSAVPSFVLDAELRPHLVYLRYIGPGQLSAVIHDWFDGTAWQSEEVGRLDVLSYAWALDPASHPVVLVSPDGTDAALHVLCRSGSTYVSENPGITFSGTSNLGGMLITASPEGVIHVLVQNYTAVSTVHAWRGASWRSEPVPLAGNVFLSKVTASTGDIVSLTTQNGLTANFQVLDRGSSGWGTPADIGTSGGLGDVLNARMTTTLAGSSPVLALNLALNGVRIARRSDGWVPRQLTGPANLMGVGYDATSHLYVIVQGGYLSSGGYRAAVFREQ